MKVDWTSFEKELTALVNRYSLERIANIPDYQIATFMADCLAPLFRATNARDAWYGMNPQPGDDWWLRVPEPHRWEK